MMWSIYDQVTGLFSGVSISCGDNSLEINIPDGCSCLLGTFDSLAERVDVETGAVVPYVPPQPGDGFTWNATAKRWVESGSDQTVANYLRQFMNID